MDWHVFLVVNVFLCVAIFCHAQANEFSTSFQNPSISSNEPNTRLKRANQNDQTVVGGNFQIRGLNIPRLASNIRQGIHQVLESIANPISDEIIAQLGSEQNFAGDDQSGKSYGEIPLSFNPENQNGPGQGQGQGPGRRGHNYPPPPPPYGPPPGPPPFGQHPPPPFGHPPPPPYGYPPPPPPYGPPPGPPPFGHPPPPPPYYNDPGRNYGNNNSGGKPDFSSQPNYPKANKKDSVDINLSVGLVMDSGNQERTTATPYYTHDTQYSNNEGNEHVALRKDPYISVKTDSNVAGYIDNDFPVILLKENEIR